MPGLWRSRSLHLSDSYACAGLGLTPGEEHWALADYLGCHPEVQAAVWDRWQVELLLTGQNLGEAGDWLDYGFYEAVPVE